MSAERVGVDCCGDRYTCNATRKCDCGCSLCYCASCYATHRLGVAKKRGARIAALEAQLAAAEKERDELRHAHARVWLKLAVCRGVLTDQERTDGEIARALADTAGAPDDLPPDDAEWDRARAALGMS